LQPTVPDQQGPVVGPTVTPQPQAPDLVAPPLQPTLVPPVQQQVPNPQAPGPEQKLEAPSLLPPPVRGQVDEITQSSIPAVVTSTVTPDGVVTPDVPVDVGTSVVAPAITTEVPTTEVAPTTGTTTTPSDVSVQTAITQPGGTSHHATHHASHPGQVTTTVVDGDHAPAGELAHTGGNTAILAIVAGSLLAAGAGRRPHGQG
jgi:hypothetical protein